MRPKHDECSGHRDVIIDSDITTEVAHAVLRSLFRLSTIALIDDTARIQCMHAHMHSLHTQVLITSTHACTVRMHAHIQYRRSPALLGPAPRLCLFTINDSTRCILHTTRNHIDKHIMTTLSNAPQTPYCNSLALVDH